MMIHWSSEADQPLNSVRNEVDIARVAICTADKLHRDEADCEGRKFLREGVEDAASQRVGWHREPGSPALPSSLVGGIGNVGPYSVQAMMDLEELSRRVAPVTV